MKDRDPGRLGRGRDQEIRVTHRSLMKPAYVRKQAVDIKRPLRLLHPDRAVRKRVKIATQRGKLSRITRAVQKLELDDRAGRDLAVDDGLVEFSAKLAADGSCPDPRARVRESHLCDVPRRSQRIQQIGREILELPIGKPTTRSLLDDRAQGLVDRVGCPDGP